MQQDGVILLHGIFRTHRSMGGMASYLKRHGFKTFHIGYPSTRQAIEEIVETIHPRVQKFMDETEGKVHFVGYSMGGLITRAYLNKYKVPKLGRVVMVGTPNHGSEVADFIKNWWLYKKLYGPAGQQLVTKLPDAKTLLGTVEYELGIIAGNKTADFIGSRIIGKENDGKVSVESTKLEGMKEHVTIPVSHVYMPHSAKVRKLVRRFLHDGHFGNR